MRRILAILFPPLAFLSIGRFFSAVISLVLIFLLVGIIICPIWAWRAVGAYEREQREQNVRDMVRAARAVADG